MVDPNTSIANPPTVLLSSSFDPKDITKSDKGFFGGLVDSKKFGLAGTWCTACLIAFEITYKAGGALPIAALASGGLVVASYVLGQSYLESKAIK